MSEYEYMCFMYIHVYGSLLLLVFTIVSGHFQSLKGQCVVYKAI